MAKVDYYALGLKPHYVFDNLVVGPHNQMAAAACLEVAKKPGEAYNPLVIYGSAGIGKTHLMQAVAQMMLQKNPKLKAKYISAERFASEVIAAIADDNVMAVRQHYSELDLLILDDIQFLVESKTAQGEFFHVFNNLHEKNHQVIMAADRPPNQLTTLDQSIRSRLEWGLSVDVKVPDINTRVQILKVKQEAQGLSLNDQILTFAAQHLTSNVRELEGFLKRLHAYVALSHQDLTMDLVQQVVREVLPAGAVLTSPSVPAAAPAIPPPPATPVPPPTEAAVSNGNGRVTPIPEIPVDQPIVSTPPKVSTPPVEKKPVAPPAVPVAAKPIAVTPIPEAPVEPEADSDEAALAHKEIGAVFFFPASKEKELDTVHKKFLDVIKKHKLKFRLKRVYSHPYECKGKINYSSFVEVCKQNRVPVAIVIGPPPDALLPEQDFYDLLSVTLDVQGVSLQLVNWTEIEKDYRYLNLALDIALVRTR